MNKSTIVIIVGIVLLGIITGLGLIDTETNNSYDFSYNEPTPEETQKPITETQDKYFTNVDDLKSYLYDIKTSYEFNRQEYVKPRYNKFDYAYWLIKKTKTDGYRFDIQYMINDELGIDDIFCSYSFSQSMTSVFINPETLSIEKKFNIIDAMYSTGENIT